MITARLRKAYVAIAALGRTKSGSDQLSLRDRSRSFGFHRRVCFAHLANIPFRRDPTLPPIETM